jgi:hypothetical protein
MPSSTSDPLPLFDGDDAFPLPPSLQGGAPTDDGLDAVFSRVAAVLSPYVRSALDADVPDSEKVSSVVRELAAFLRCRAAPPPVRDNEDVLSTSRAASRAEREEAREPDRRPRSRGRHVPPENRSAVPRRSDREAR